MKTSSIPGKSPLFQTVNWIFSALCGSAAYLSESFLQWVEAGYPEEAAEGEEEGMPEDLVVPDIYFFPYFYL